MYVCVCVFAGLVKEQITNYKNRAKISVKWSDFQMNITEFCLI